MRLRDVKGLRYIAFLLAAPGVDVHVLELVAAADGSPTGGAEVVGDGLRGARPADLGPLLDPRAREEYRRRLEDLRSGASPTTSGPRGSRRRSTRWWRSSPGRRGSAAATGHWGPLRSGPE